MEPQERIRLLSEWLVADSVGAEIGVWTGDFAAQILAEVRPRELFLIDPWEFQADFPASWYGGGKARSQADMDAIYVRVQQRFATQIAAGEVRIMRTRSLDTSTYPGLDWAYIDGNHTYAAVTSDIEHWSQKLNPDGVLILDDFGTHGWWDNGVTRAVEDACARGMVEVTAIKGTQVILRRVEKT